MKLPDHVFVFVETYTCHTYWYAYRLYCLLCWQIRVTCISLDKDIYMIRCHTKKKHNTCYQLAPRPNKKYITCHQLTTHPKRKPVKPEAERRNPKWNKCVGATLIALAATLVLASESSGQNTAVVPHVRYTYATKRETIQKVASAQTYIFRVENALNAYVNYEHTLSRVIHNFFKVSLLQEK
jgi:hypothetical protein